MASGFVLPPNMSEASPSDVQRVLDAVDVLYIDSEATDTPSIPTDHLAIETMARQQGMTAEQWCQKALSKAMPPLIELRPVADLIGFRVRRFTEIGSFTQAVIIRDFGEQMNAERSEGSRASRMIGDDPQYAAEDAHIHLWSGRGLTLDFDYDLPGARRATVADCEELVRHLSQTAIVGL